MTSAYEFLNKMDAYMNGLSTPPDYEKHSAKFLCGVRVFEQYLGYFNELKRGKV
jgi:hypothetical protein